jgi:hypothetical protein
VKRSASETLREDLAARGIKHYQFRSGRSGPIGKCTCFACRLREKTRTEGALAVSEMPEGEITKLTQ